MSKGRSNRRGYALMLVMVFVVLFAAILGVAWRRVGSALRIEHLSELRKQCDQGSVQVLAQAMRLLETHLRWHPDGGGGTARIDLYDSPPPYYQVLNNTDAYKVVFSREGANDGREWSVSVSVVRLENVDLSHLLPAP